MLAPGQQRQEDQKSEASLPYYTIYWSRNTTQTTSISKLFKPCLGHHAACTSFVSFGLQGNLGKWKPGQDRVFQMDVLPEGLSAKARGWGSPCLHRGQRLRPIFAGFQVLIRKGGVQRGPFGTPQCSCLLFSLSFGAWQDFPPSLLQTENAKASKSRCLQAKTGCILVELA